MFTNQFEKYFSIPKPADLFKRESVNFPKLLKDYMDKKFSLEHKKYIHFNEKTHKSKLDNTINQIENYIDNTIPRAYEKKFITIKRVFTQILLQKKMN